MKHIKLFLIILFISGTLFAQRGTLGERSNDAFNEVDGKLSLYFFDALNGKPIFDAKVTIEKSETSITNLDGAALFETEVLNEKLKVLFEHEEYYTSNFEIEIMAGSIFFNRFSVSPKMRVGNIRIVLDWSNKPEDLDAHFVKANDYHISYRNKHEAADNAAKLDRDDTDGFGPETITVNKVDQNAHYYFYVHDYTNDGEDGNTYLAESRATIKIFDKVHGLVKVIPISLDVIGDRWNVFEINQGTIIYFRWKNMFCKTSEYFTSTILIFQNLSLSYEDVF